MNKTKFNGIFPAVVTPLTDKEELNDAVLRKLIAFQIAQGADGFYIGGATGEGLRLEAAVRERLCETAIEAIGPEWQKIVHISDMNIKTTERLAKQAEAAGADAISAVPPLYFSYNENDIYNYYKKIASFVHIPLMLYYTPAAHTKLSVNLLKKLFEIDNITAIKWTSSNFFDLMLLKDVTHGECSIMNGLDEMLICGLAAGADGGIGTSYNILLPYFKKILHAFRCADIQEARRLQTDCSRIIHILIEYNVIAATKAVLTYMGFAVGHPAFPQEVFSPEKEKELLERLFAAGFPLPAD